MSTSALEEAWKWTCQRNQGDTISALEDSSVWNQPRICSQLTGLLEFVGLLFLTDDLKMADWLGFGTKVHSEFFGAWVMTTMLALKKTPSNKWQICLSFFSLSCLAFAAVESTFKLDWWAFFSVAIGAVRSLFHQALCFMKLHLSYSQGTAVAALAVSSFLGGCKGSGYLVRFQRFQLFGAPKKNVPRFWELHANMEGFAPLFTSNTLFIKPSSIQPPLHSWILTKNIRFLARQKWLQRQEAEKFLGIFSLSVIPRFS